MKQIWHVTLKVLRIVAGGVLVLLGVAGLAAPVLPGWLFIIPGILLLTKDVPFVRRLVCRFLNSGLMRRMERRFPKTHDPLQRLREKLRTKPHRHREHKQFKTGEPTPQRDPA